MTSVSSSRLISKNVLGTGGFATVYGVTISSESGESRVEYAVKKINPLEKEASDNRILNRWNMLKREYEALQVLSQYPKSPYTVEFVGKIGDLSHPIKSAYRPPLFVMKPASGEELAKHLSKQGVWELKDALCLVAYPALQAIASWVQKGIVHGDLKTENIFYDEAEKKITIIDFGLAQRFSPQESLWLSNRVAGTKGFIAPEVFKRSEASPRKDLRKFDIWGLAGVLIVLALGVHAVDGIFYKRDDYWASSGNRDEAFRLIPDDELGFRYKEILSQMLQVDIDKRKSSQELLSSFFTPPLGRILAPRAEYALETIQGEQETFTTEEDLQIIAKMLQPEEGRKECAIL